MYTYLHYKGKNTGGSGGRAKGEIVGGSGGGIMMGRENYSKKVRAMETEIEMRVEL